MKELVRTDLKYVFESKAMLDRLHCDPDDEPYERALELLDQATEYLSPAFAIKEFATGAFDHNGVHVSGQFFDSKIAAEKLKNQQSVFIYIATCGKKIDSLIDNTDDVMDQYLFDQFAYLAYLQAMKHMSAQVEEQFGIKRYVMLCPGSIIDWSIIDVKKIFVLLDGLYQQLDAQVLDSGLIDPLKSTSGMFYPTDEEFESCAICPRANCENRKMPFDEELHQKMVNL